MLPKPRSAEYFDGWYADQAARPAVAEIMSRHMGFSRETRAGTVPAEALAELTEELRLRPGGRLLDLACGRGAYGLLVAKQAGTALIGVDFSAQALTEGREQAARMGVRKASFRLGELTSAGLPDASVDPQASSWRDELQRIQAPALVIAGGSASHVDQCQLAGMAALIPDCELTTIPAGHLVHAVRPAEFTAAVTTFLGAGGNLTGSLQG